jgi:hypothetical protein
MKSFKKIEVGIVNYRYLAKTLPSIPKDVRLLGSRKG